MNFCKDCGGETYAPLKLCGACMAWRIDHAQAMRIAKELWIQGFAQSYVADQMAHRHGIEPICSTCEKSYEYALEELGPKEWDEEASHLWVQEHGER